MGFFSKSVGMVGIFQRAFVVPIAGLVVALLVVLGGRAMGPGSFFVIFSCLPMGLVHRSS